MTANRAPGPRYVRVVDDPVAMAPVIRILREMRKARLADEASLDPPQVSPSPG